ALLFVGNGYPSGKEPDGLPKFDFKGNPTPDGGKTIHRLRPWRVEIPKGATSGALYYEYPKPDSRYEYYGSLDFVYCFSGVDGARRLSRCRAPSCQGSVRGVAGRCRRAGCFSGRR